MKSVHFNIKHRLVQALCAMGTAVFLAISGIVFGSEGSTDISASVDQKGNSIPDRPPEPEIDDTRISMSGYRLENGYVFNDGLELWERQATRLITPDGKLIEGEFAEHFFGYAYDHWVNWEGHESWEFDILSTWSGGRCCYTNWFVSKTRPYRVLPRMYTGQVPLYLEDVNEDGKMEFITHETGYWFHTNEMNEPFISVIWEMTDEGPKISRELLKTTLLAEEDLSKYREIARLKHGVPGEIYEFTNAVTEPIIHQYYATGDLGYARALFNDMWPGIDSDKEKMWYQITLQLSCGDYGIEGIKCPWNIDD